MTTNENIYTIDGTKTLIDLNEDKKNFQITVEIEGENHFLFSIVNQTMLDNMSELNFEETIKTKKTVTHKDGPFQNYFLVLKSKNGEETRVKVTKYTTELGGGNDGVTPISALNRRDNIERSQERSQERH